MEISFNYDSDETYLSEGERMLEENHNHEIDSNGEKSQNTKIRKVRKSISLKGIRNKIESIKKCLNKWFEKNEGLPKFLLKDYISHLTKFKLIANQKIKAESLEKTERDLWNEVFQVCDKLKDIVDYVVKRSELANSQKIDESDTNDNEEIIIEEETPNTNGSESKMNPSNEITEPVSKNEQIEEKNTFENDNINKKVDFSNKISCEPSSKQEEKINEENTLENDNISQNLNDLSIECTVIPSSVNVKPKCWKKNVSNKKNLKSQKCKREIKKKSIKFYEIKDNDGDIDFEETPSDDLKNSSQIEIVKIAENEIEKKMNKIPGEISLSQMSRHLSPNFSEKSTNKNENYLFSKFWPHSEMEYLNHEILWPTLWHKNGKIPEEFYKDLNW